MKFIAGIWLWGITQHSHNPSPSPTVLAWFPIRFLWVIRSTSQFKDRKLEEETELMTSWHWLINVLVRKLKMDCDPKQRSFRHSMHKDFWRKSYCLFRYLRCQALVEKSELEPYFSHNRFSKCSNHTVTIPVFFFLLEKQWDTDYVPLHSRPALDSMRENKGPCF